MHRIYSLDLAPEKAGLLKRRSLLKLGSSFFCRLDCSPAFRNRVGEVEERPNRAPAELYLSISEVQIPLSVFVAIAQLDSAFFGSRSDSNPLSYHNSPGDARQLNRADSKSVVLFTVPRVRIPLSPLFFILSSERGGRGGRRCARKTVCLTGYQGSNPLSPFPLQC